MRFLLLRVAKKVLLSALFRLFSELGNIELYQFQPISVKSETQLNVIWKRRSIFLSERK